MPRPGRGRAGRRGAGGGQGRDRTADPTLFRRVEHDPHLFAFVHMRRSEACLRALSSGWVHDRSRLWLPAWLPGIAASSRRSSRCGETAEPSPPTWPHRARPVERVRRQGLRKLFEVYCARTTSSPSRASHPVRRPPVEVDGAGPSGRRRLQEGLAARTARKPSWSSRRVWQYATRQALALLGAGPAHGRAGDGGTAPPTRQARSLAVEQSHFFHVGLAPSRYCAFMQSGLMVNALL